MLILNAQSVLPTFAAIAAEKGKKSKINYDFGIKSEGEVVGQVNENYIKKLLFLLDVEFIHCEGGTVYDVVHKADFIIKLPEGGGEIWLQVKSSETGVKSHLAKYPQSLSTVVLPSGNIIQDIQILKSQFGFKLKSEVIEGIKLHKKLGKGNYPLSIYQKIFKPYQGYLTTLGLIAQVGNSLVIR